MMVQDWNSLRPGDQIHTRKKVFTVLEWRKSEEPGSPNVLKLQTVGSAGCFTTSAFSSYEYSAERASGAPDEPIAAFPSPICATIDGSLVVTDEPGMSLRDYFAAAALTGISAVLHPARAARLAYEHADAMMAARGKA